MGEGGLMKIVAINGSHTGRAGNTNIMVSALLKGAQEAGAEILLEQNFIPDEIYIQEVKKSVDSMVKK